MRRLSLSLLIVILLVMGLLEGCSGTHDSASENAAGASLVSVGITPVNPAIAKGTTKQFTATGIYSDNTTQDVTSSVTWSSSDNAIATLNSTGLASGLAVGSATITATSGNISGTTVLTVTSAALTSIAVTPTNPSIALGTKKQFTATGTFTDNTTQDLTASVTWATTDATRATIDNAGLATGAGVGTATITAASGAVSGNTILTVTVATLVSISVTPSNPSSAKGLTKQFKATGLFTDNTTPDITASVTWNSSDLLVAQISNAAGSKGLAATLGTGTTLISAIEPASSITGTTMLTVTDAVLTSLTVAPANGANGNINNGYTQQFTATGTFSDTTTQDITSQVTWESTDPTKATIDATGLVTSLAAGTTIIKATSGTIFGTSALTINPALDACAAISSCTDTDGDGFCDAWEDNDYIDLNGNGVYDEGTNFKFPHAIFSSVTLTGTSTGTLSPTPKTRWLTCLRPLSR